MEEISMSVKDVYLDYPSTVYNRKTLKQTVFELIKLQKPQKVLHDVHALRGISLSLIHICICFMWFLAWCRVDIFDLGIIPRFLYNY